MNLRKNKKGFMRGADGKRKKEKLCDYIKFQRNLFENTQKLSFKTTPQKCEKTFICKPFLLDKFSYFINLLICI